MAEVAKDQWGVVDHRQLRRCGIGRSTISRWTAEGRFHRLYRGVYAVGHPALPVEGKLVAALFCGGPGATLSHGTAAWWWGLVDERPILIDVSLDRRRRPAEGIAFHTRSRVDRVWQRRLPVTTVAQTLLDLAATESFDRVRQALAEAEFKSLIDLGEVRSALRRGRPGSAALRTALHRHMPRLARTRSELERRFLFLCESAGLPLPEPNARFRGYRIDALWREQRVAVELDGLDGHRTPAQLQRDHQRDLVMRTAGYLTRRYTWDQVTREAALVEADLRAALLEADLRAALAEGVRRG